MAVTRRGRGCGRPDSVDAARDKHSTRAYMAKAGLPTPRNMLIERPDQVEAAGNHVGFPAGGHPGMPRNVDQSRAGDLQAFHHLSGKLQLHWRQSNRWTPGEASRAERHQLADDGICLRVMFCTSNGRHGCKLALWQRGS